MSVSRRGQALGFAVLGNVLSGDIYVLLLSLKDAMRCSMVRFPRTEYAGAIYHIISRGNYRKDLFTVVGSAKAFEKALFKVLFRCGWKIHAYVIMSNYYHICLETPYGNLIERMRWLQGTFGKRLNRFVESHGHVFQARYKSLLVSLVSLVNYVHLNPG